MAALLVWADPLVVRAESAATPPATVTGSAVAEAGTIATAVPVEAGATAATTASSTTPAAGDTYETHVTADTLRLALSDAVTRALESSARLAGLEATNRGADAAARGARAAGLPLVELSAGYSRYSDVPGFVITLPGGRPLSIAPNIPDAWRARASVSVPLFTGGRIASTAEAARSERDATESDLEAARADLVLETTTAYWNLRLQTESASVLTEALAAYEAHLADARHRGEVGLAARSEVLAVEVERSRAELGRLQADGAAAVAEENLRRLLGVGERIVIVAVDQPGDRQTLPSAAADRSVDEPTPRSAAVEQPPDHPAPLPEAAGQNRQVERGEEINPLALEPLVSTALATRPERGALASRVAAAEARARAEQRARWPQLAAVAGYDYANPNRRITPAQAEWKETWDASVNLSLPLFDSGRISAATARARAQAEALKQQAIDLDQRIRLEVNLRVIERRTAEEAVAVAERAVEAARENEMVTRDRYREGVASSSDLLDAEVKSLRAALDRTDARARLLLAGTNLDRAVGRLR